MAYIRKKMNRDDNGNLTGPYFYLQESYREGKKVRTRHIAYLGKDYQLAQMRAKDFSEGKLTQADLEREFGTGTSGKRGRPKAKAAPVDSAPKMPIDQRKDIAEKVASYKAQKDEYPVNDPETSISESMKFAVKKYGSFKKMEAAANRGDEDALSAVALYERANEAAEARSRNPNVRYGDKHLDDIIKENNADDPAASGKAVLNGINDRYNPLPGKVNVGMDGMKAVEEAGKRNSVQNASAYGPYAKGDAAKRTAEKLKAGASFDEIEADIRNDQELAKIHRLNGNDGVADNYSNSAIGMQQALDEAKLKKVQGFYDKGVGAQGIKKIQEGRPNYTGEELDIATTKAWKMKGAEMEASEDFQKGYQMEKEKLEREKPDVGLLSYERTLSSRAIGQAYLDADGKNLTYLLGRDQALKEAFNRSTKANGFEAVKVGDGKKESGGYWTLKHNGQGTAQAGRMSESEAKAKADELNRSYTTDDPLVGRKLSSFNPGGLPYKTDEIIMVDKNPKGMKEGTVNAMLSSGHVVTMSRENLEREIAVSEEKAKPVVHSKAVINAMAVKEEAARKMQEAGAEELKLPAYSVERKMARKKFEQAEAEFADASRKYNDALRKEEKEAQIAKAKQKVREPSESRVVEAPAKNEVASMSMDSIDDELDVLMKKYQRNSLDGLMSTVAFHSNASTLAGEDARKDRERVASLLDRRGGLIKAAYEARDERAKGKMVARDAVEVMRKHGNLDELGDRKADTAKLISDFERSGDVAKAEYYKGYLDGLNEHSVDTVVKTMQHRGENIELHSDGKYWLREEDNHRVLLSKDSEADARAMLDNLKDNPRNAPYLVPDKKEMGEHGISVAEYNAELKRLAQEPYNPPKPTPFQEWAKDKTDEQLQKEWEMASNPGVAWSSQKEKEEWLRNIEWEQKRRLNNLQLQVRKDTLDKMNGGTDHKSIQSQIYQALDNARLAEQRNDYIEAGRNIEIARGLGDGVADYNKAHFSYQYSDPSPDYKATEHMFYGLSVYNDPELRKEFEWMVDRYRQKGVVPANESTSTAGFVNEIDYLRELEARVIEKEKGAEAAKTFRTESLLNDMRIQLEREQRKWNAGARPEGTREMMEDSKAEIAKLERELKPVQAPPKKNWMDEHVIIAGVKKKPDITTRAKILGGKSLVQEVPEGQVWDTHEGNYILIRHDGTTEHMTSTEAYNRYVKKKLPENNGPMASPDYERNAGQIAANAYNMLIGGIASEKRIEDSMETERKLYELAKSKGQEDAAASHKASYDGQMAGLEKYRGRESINVVGDQAKEMREDWERSSNRRFEDVDGSPKWRELYVASNLSDAQEAMARGNKEQAKYFLKMAQYNNSNKEGFKGFRDEAQSSIFDMWNMVMYDRNASLSKNNKGKSFDTIANETKMKIFTDVEKKYEAKKKATTPVGQSDYSFYEEEAKLGVKASQRHEWGIVEANSLGYYILKGIGKDEEAEALKASAKTMGAGTIDPALKEEAEAMVKKARNERAAMVMAYSVLEDSNAHTENRAWTEVAKKNGIDITEKRKPDAPKAKAETKSSKDEEGRKAAENFVKRKKKQLGMSTEGGNYITEYRFEEVESGGKKYQIPVAEDGTVPEEFLVMRYLEVEQGNRGPGNRNPIIDSSIDAEIIIPKNAKAKDIAKWWAYPNESDIKDLDTTSARLWDVGGATGKGSKEANRKIAIVGGTKGDHDAIREIISKSFTVKEQRQLGGVTIFVTDIPNAGEYHGRFAGTGYLVKIQRGHAKDPDTVTHELVHHLRAVDPDRDGINKRPDGAMFDNRDRDLEEASTEAETVTRHKKFDMNMRGGYYQTFDNDGTHKRGNAKRREDRGLFTKKEVNRETDGTVSSDNPQLVNSGIKGKRGLNSVENNFAESNIAHLKWNQKKVEAIDRHYEIRGKDGKKVGVVQAYNKDGKDIPPAMHVPEGGEVNEWHDGKKVKLEGKN